MHLFSLEKHNICCADLPPPPPFLSFFFSITSPPTRSIFNPTSQLHFFSFPSSPLQAVSTKKFEIRLKWLEKQIHHTCKNIFICCRKKKLNLISFFQLLTNCGARQPANVWRVRAIYGDESRGVDRKHGTCSSLELYQHSGDLL